MSSTAFAAVLAFAAGLGGAVQIAVQGRLGDRVGSLEAVATAAVVGVVLALVVLLVTRRSVSGVGDAIAGPKWQLLGGSDPNDLRPVGDDVRRHWKFETRIPIPAGQRYVAVRGLWKKGKTLGTSPAVAAGG